MKNSFIFLLFLLAFLSGCISPKSYIDPMYDKTDSSSVKKVTNKYNSNIGVEFQRNGEHFPAVDAELRMNVEEILIQTGVITPTTEDCDIKIKITCNNIADIASARAKGFGTGLTFGVAGTSVSDYYNVSIEYRQGSDVVEKSYDHAIHSTIGNRASPIEGATPLSVRDAFKGVLEDIILEFLKEMQSQNLLTVNGHTNTTNT